MTFKIICFMTTLNINMIFLKKYYMLLTKTMINKEPLEQYSLKTLKKANLIPLKKFKKSLNKIMIKYICLSQVLCLQKIKKFNKITLKDLKIIYLNSYLNLNFKETLVSKLEQLYINTEIKKYQINSSLLLILVEKFLIVKYLRLNTKKICFQHGLIL